MPDSTLPLSLSVANTDDDAIKEARLKVQATLKVHPPGTGNPPTREAYEWEERLANDFHVLGKASCRPLISLLYSKLPRELRDEVYWHLLYDQSEIVELRSPGKPSYVGPEVNLVREAHPDDFDPKETQWELLPQEWRYYRDPDYMSEHVVYEIGQLCLRTGVFTFSYQVLPALGSFLANDIFCAGKPVGELIRYLRISLIGDTKGVCYCMYYHRREPWTPRQEKEFLREYVQNSRLHLRRLETQVSGRCRVDFRLDHFGSGTWGYQEFRALLKGIHPVICALEREEIAVGVVVRHGTYYYGKVKPRLTRASSPPFSQCTLFAMACGTWDMLGPRLDQQINHLMTPDAILPAGFHESRTPFGLMLATQPTILERRPGLDRYGYIFVPTVPGCRGPSWGPEIHPHRYRYIPDSPGIFMIDVDQAR